MNDLSREEMISEVQKVIAAEFARAREGKQADPSTLRKGFLVIAGILGTVEMAMVPFEVIDLYRKFTSDNDAERRNDHGHKNVTPLVPAPSMPAEAPPLSDEERKLLWGNAGELLARASFYQSMALRKAGEPARQTESVLPRTTP